MQRESVWATAVGRLARLPFGIRKGRSFRAPHKAIIMQACCMSQVMLATPLLAALSEAFPEARFDWLLGEWARPVLTGNPRVTEIVPLKADGGEPIGWRELGDLIRRLRAAHYDTVFIPSHSAQLGVAAWQAGIAQRVGLDVQGRGFAHTMAIRPDPAMRDRGSQGLLLAEAAGVPSEIAGRVNMEFYPPDQARRTATQRLIEEVDWLGDVPLVIFHPGGGGNPIRAQPQMRWPAERFVILGNYLAQNFGARVVVAAAEGERAIADDIAGLMAGPVVNYCGRISLGELGAMCEVADLYVGNDCGTTHVAAACGCQTLVIYGPTDPAVSRPYSSQGNVHLLWHDLSEFAAERPFTWDIGVTAEEAIAAAEGILRKPKERGRTMAILSKRPPENN